MRTCRKKQKGPQEEILPMAHLLSDIFYISAKAASMVIFLWSISIFAYSILFNIFAHHPPLFYEYTISLDYIADYILEHLSLIVKPHVVVVKRILMEWATPQK
jgi:hypothetical protein